MSLADLQQQTNKPPPWKKKKTLSKKSSGTKNFGNPNGTEAAFVIGLQSPGSIQGDTVVEGRGKHPIIGRCRIFNLAFKGHHSQNVAIGLTGLTLGNSFSKYSNLWMVGISLSSCLNVNQLKGNVTEVTVWGCSLCLTFLSVSQKDNERETKPKHYHSPIQQKNKIEGSGKGLQTQNDQQKNNSTYPPQGKNQESATAMNSPRLQGQWQLCEGRLIPHKDVIFQFDTEV